MGSPPHVLLTGPDRALHLAGQAGRGALQRTHDPIFPSPSQSLSPRSLEALRVLVADEDKVTLRATRRLLEQVGIMASPHRTRSNTWRRGPHRRDEGYQLLS